MAILTEFFRLLELRDRVTATAENYQKKLIRRFKTAKEENKLRGASPRVVDADIEKEQYLDAAKTIVNYFAEGDPTKQNKYLDWIVRQFIKGHLLWEDSFKMKKLLTDFETYRTKLDRKDLNQYEHYHDLEEVLEPLRGTEVAGIRVQNFLKKAEVQKLRKNMVADPTHSMNYEGLEALHGDEDNPPSIPSWYEEQVADSAAEFADESIDMDDLIDAARDELDEDDYTDEHGVVDEDEMQSDAERAAESEHFDRKQDYIDDYVREHGQSEWEEYWEGQREHDKQQLARSMHKTPELDVVYESDRMAVLIPNSKDAACFIGKGTEWCTAAEESDNYWWEYAKEEPLYAVVTDKLGKFQFHFNTDQYMDEHDRYIEDSDALVSLVKRYPKELEEAFGRLAEEDNEWWLLPIEKIPSDFWDQMLKQTSRGGSHYDENVVRDAVRVWQRHNLNAPEGWSEEIRANILSGRFSETAVKKGWFGKVEDHEMDAAIKKGLHDGTIQSVEQTARYVSENEIEISPEAWLGLIMDNDNALFYAPIELIDRKLVDALINRSKDSPRRGYSRTSYLGEFYPKFKELLDRAEAGADPDAKFSSPAHPWSGSGLERARKIAGMVTMDDVINSVLRYPDDLTRFKMDFGMKPWMAVARNAMKQGEEDVNDFIRTASSIVRSSDEPWTKDIVNLIHQVTRHFPQTIAKTYQYPQDDLPLDTENAILDYIARNVDPRARQRIAQEIQQTLDNYNTGGYKEVRLSPEAAEVLKAYRLDNQMVIDRARKGVPAQQQLDM